MVAADDRTGSKFGRYQLRRLLGRGGMGDVYEAYDTTKDRTVALKILRPELSCDERFRTRFQRESHAAAMLEDPHVIPIYDWGEIGGSLYIDMRLVRGQDLHELLRRGRLEPARAVGIIRQVASALDAAHARGLIHRDIKPQNILLTSAEDFAYLIDFGIAQNLADTRLTTEGSAVGSVAYMAPERFEDRPTTAAVDVYSLAAVLYEMLTGEVPFRANGLEQLIAAHTSSPPPRPSMVNPRLPAAFDDVIARGMAKDPDDRFGTAGGLGRAAQRALDGTSSPGSDSGPFATTRQAPPGYPSAGDAEPFRPQGQPGPQGSNRNRPWLVPAAIVMGAALLAGVGVIIGLLVQQNHVTSPTPAPTTGNAAPSPGSYPPQLPTSGESVPPPAPPFTGSPPPAPASLARPPLISGPDTSASHQSCDYGWSLIEASGWGSHAGRGTPETSCFFAGSVLKSYWNQYGNASRQLRRVSAPGAVDCGTVDGAVCDGSNFLIQCAAYGSDNWITCTGGKNARIYLY